MQKIVLTLVVCFVLFGYARMECGTVSAADDLATMQSLLIQMRANEDSIMSWKGTVRVSKELKLPDANIPTVFIREENSEWSIAYCYDVLTGNKCSLATPISCRQLLSSGERITPMDVYIGAMSLPAKSEYYSYRYYPTRLTRVTYEKRDADGKLFLEEKYERRNSILLHPKESNDWELPFGVTYFDPFKYLNRDPFADQPAHKKLESLSRLLAKNETNTLSDEWRLFKEGTQVVIEMSAPIATVRHFFDTAKGAMLVKMTYENTYPDGQVKTSTWECEPQCVSGIWIPHKVKILSESNNQTIDFADTVLNLPRSEIGKEFTLAAIGAHQGDVLEDLRTHTRTVLQGENLLPPEHH